MNDLLQKTWNKLIVKISRKEHMHALKIRGIVLIVNPKEVLIYKDNEFIFSYEFASEEFHVEDPDEVDFIQLSKKDEQ